MHMLRVWSIALALVVCDAVEFIVDSSVDSPPDSSLCSPNTGHCNLRSAWESCLEACGTGECTIRLPVSENISLSAEYGDLTLEPHCNIVVTGNGAVVTREGFVSLSSQPVGGEFPLDTGVLDDTDFGTTNYAEACLTGCYGEVFKFTSCDQSGDTQTSASGDTVFSLFENGTEVAFNDDYCGVVSEIVYGVSTEGCSELCLRVGCYSSTSCSAIVGAYSETAVAEPYLRFIAYSYSEEHSISSSELISVPRLELSNMTLRGFEAPFGGALYFDGNCALNLSHVVFDSNLADRGGALYLTDNTESVRCDYCVFDTNQATYDGGGVYVDNNVANVTFSDSVFFGCEAGDSGGAVMVMLNSTIAFMTSSFFRCECGQYGGAVFVYEENDIVVQNVNFESCSSGQDGGAIYVSTRNILYISGTFFRSCDAGGKGGMLYVYQSNHNVTIDNSYLYRGIAGMSNGCLSVGYDNRHMVISNTVFTSCEGEGISSYGGCVGFQADNDGMSLLNVTMSDCHASGQGGCVHISSGSLGVRISDSTFIRCTAYSEGGGVYIGNDQDEVSIVNTIFDSCVSEISSGGAVYIGASSASPKIMGCQIYNCSAGDFGGGIYFADNVAGGVVAGSYFSRCSAASGGGGVACGTDTESLLIENCTFVDCTADVVGGAVFVGLSGADTTIKFCEFYTNSAYSGGGVCLYDGNLDSHIVECLFDGNYASYGGALTAFTLVRPVIAGCDIKENRASSWGAGLYFASSSSQLLISDSEAFYQSVVVTHTNGDDIYFEPGEVNGSTELIVLFDADVTLKSSESIYFIANNELYFIVNDANIPGINYPALHIPSTSVAVYYSDSRIEATFTITPVFPESYPTKRTVIEENVGYSGAGIMLNRDSRFGIIVNTHIRNNTALSGPGGGVYLRSTNTGTTLQQVVVEGNRALANGGGLVIGMAHIAVSILNCIVRNNTAGGIGGGVLISSENGINDFPLLSEILVSGCSIVNNLAVTGAGIAVESSNKVNISLSEVNDNTAAGYGGGVLLDEFNSVLMSDCLVHGNHADRGGGIQVSRSNEMQLARTNVSSNSAKTTGGGLMILSETKLTFEGDNVLMGNSADIFGGAIASIESEVWEVQPNSSLRILRNTASRGSGLFFKALKNYQSFTIDGNKKELNSIVFDSNYASVGGTVYWLADSDMTTEPPGLNNPSVLWVGNSAKYGNRSATQACTLVGPTTYMVNVYDQDLTPALEYHLLDYYNQTVLVDDDTSVVATIADGSEQCGEGIPLLEGTDVVGSGVPVVEGMAFFDSLRVRCTPGGNLTVRFEAHLGNLLGIPENIGAPYYISTATTLRLRECVAGEYLSEGECVVCPKGQYNLVAYDECTECLSHDGIEDCFASQIVVKEGYWRRYPSHSTVQECPLQSSCRGGNSTGNDLCAGGCEGVLCAVCSSGYFLSNDECVKCEGVALLTPQTLVFILIVVIAFGLAAASIFFRRRTQKLKSRTATQARDVSGASSVRSDQPRASSDETSDDNCWSSMQKSVSKLMGRIKIAVATYQIITEAGTVLAIDFPSNFNRFLNALDFVNLDIMGILPLSCAASFSFIDTLVITTLTPIALCSLLWLCFIVEYMWIRRQIQSNKNRKKGDKRRAFNLAKEKYLNLFFYLTYLVLPSATTTIFKMFLCTNVDPNDEDDNSSDVFLTADMSISCDSGLYYGGVIYASVMILVYPVGIPCLYFALLCIHNDEIQSRDTTKIITPIDTAVETANPMQTTTLQQGPVEDVSKRPILSAEVQRLSFLWKAYRPRCWYFEIIETTRRLVLTAILSVCAPGSSEQAVLSILLALGYLKLYNYCSPYTEDVDSIMGETGQYQIMFTFLGALVVEYELVRHDMISAVGWSLIVVNMSVLVLQLYFSWCVLVSEKESDSAKNSQRSTQSLQPGKAPDHEFRIDRREKDSDDEYSSEEEYEHVTKGEMSSTGLHGRIDAVCVRNNAIVDTQISAIELTTCQPKSDV